METKVAEKKHIYKIKVDDLILEFHEQIVIGSEILIRAEKTPVECFTLYQKFKGCDFEKINSDEKIDLSKPGLEHFTVKPPEVFHYTIDEEPETTEKSHLTANEILQLAGLDSKDYYLTQIYPEEVSYKDKPTEAIKMICPGYKFISAYRGGTTVAWGKNGGF